MKMEEFLGWLPISYAPKDGSEFYGGHEGTGSVRVTWHSKKTAETPFDEMFGKAFFGEEGPVWWCRHDDDRVTSFAPTHFLPMESDRRNEDISKKDIIP